jgi:hypothetical protein
MKTVRSSLYPVNLRRSWASTEVAGVPRPGPLGPVCGRPATHVELRLEDDGWRFIYRGIAAGNGGGDIITDERAGLLTAAFAHPPDFALMR